MKLHVGGDTNYFSRGAPMRMTTSGQLVPMTRCERIVAWSRDRWLGATRWWRPRTVVSAIDHAEGCITLATERWSWRRWRWERM